MAEQDDTVPASAGERDLTLDGSVGEHDVTLAGHDYLDLATTDATVSIKSEGAGSADVARSRLHLHPHILRTVGGPDGGDLDYELTRTLGKGGMGVVYSARQASLDRRIAVKMIQSDGEVDSVAANKFLSEALVTGELDHPNIIPIHDLGKTPDGKLFYAMKEIEGTSWNEVVKTKSQAENLRILLAVCDAVAFAHDKGVIHRDLKPSNVMIGGYGEVLVMDWGLAASVGSDKAEPLTEHATLAGSPAYMAPEMALCDYTAMGCASDIYLLGAILYEMITGKPPHPGDNARDAIAAACDNELRPTDEKGELVDIARHALATDPAKRYASVREFQEAIHNHQAHAESVTLTESAANRLDAVAEKGGADAYREFNEIIGGFQQALHLWAGNRQAVYGLRAVREELTRTALTRGDLSLAGSQVRAIEADVKQWPLPGMQLARPDDLAAKVKEAEAEARRRRRVVRLSIVAAIVAGLAAFAVMAMAYVVTRTQRDRAMRAERQMLEERNRAVAAEQEMHVERDRAQTAKMEEERQRLQAVAALATAEQENYYHMIALASKRMADLQGHAAEAMLWQVPQGQRGWEWGRLVYAAHECLARLKGHGGSVAALAFAPDGQRVVSAAADQTVRVWNLADPSREEVFDGRAATALPLVFTADGKRILWGVERGRLQFMDVASHRVTSIPLDAFVPSVYQSMFSPDGRHLVASGAQGELAVWALETGRRLVQLTGHQGVVLAAAMNRAGTLLLTGSRDATARVWQISDGSLVATLGPHPGGVSQVAFDERAQQVSTVSDDALLRVWDVASRQTLKLIPFREPDVSLDGVVFDPAAEQLLTVGGSSAVQVWSAVTGQRTLHLRGHAAVVSAAAFSPDGRLAVTGGRDGSIRVWDAHHTGSSLTLRGHEGAVVTARFGPHARQMVTAGEDGHVRLWGGLDGRLVKVFDKQTGRLTCASLSPDGRHVLTASDGGTTRIWDAQTGGMLRALSGHGGAITWAAYSPDGGRIVTAGYDGLRVWDADSGKRPITIRVDKQVSRIAEFSPDGRLLLMAGDGVRIWDAVSGDDVGHFDKHTDHVTTLAFSRDGQYVITGSRDMTARLWSLPGCEEKLTLKGAGSAVSAVAFSPDGRRVATAGKQGIRIWDATNGSELLKLEGHQGWIASLQFSADGRLLLSAGNDGTARVWPAVDWQGDPARVDTERDQRRRARLNSLLPE
ncbi:MAG: protein kinase [Verrucomicrobia bacterium]|jgi:WD40 repeat protein|nr:protein kinase [Verrucomicrobiota bacterium]MBT7065733.1 protein kinase [Verrucomicrobiota bacterium]MBT7699484.1 protein kinase [Verrucomicrobiota bacterium]